MQLQSADARFSAERSLADRFAPARALTARLSPEHLSLDTWAVGLALLVVVLVRAGVLSHSHW